MASVDNVIWQTFLSYSRQQYACAEQLVLQLQNHGVSVWFDVQQLEPGTQWPSDIQHGLEQSASVLLLASKAALASPYVEREWRYAIAQQRPVIIALVERVRLPPELRAVPIVDCRGDLAPCITRLQQIIQIPGTPYSRPSALPRLAPGVRRSMTALFLRDFSRITLLLLLLILWTRVFAWTNVVGFALRWTEDAANQSGLPLVLGDFSGLFLLGLFGFALLSGLALLDLRLFRFMRRDLRVLIRDLHKGPNTAGLVIGLWLALASGHLPFVVDYYRPRGAAPLPPVELGMLAVAIVAVLIIHRRFARSIPPLPDADLLRWANAESVPDGWRSELYSRWITAKPAPQKARPVEPVDASGHIRLRALVEPPDLPVLDAIRPTIKTLGAEIVSPDAPANYTLLILSHASSRARIGAALTDETRKLVIIASSFNIPPELEALGQVQFVDFSTRNFAALTASLGLIFAEDDARRRQAQPHLKPVNLKRIAPPRVISSLTANLFLLILLTLLALGTALWQRSDAPWITPFSVICSLTGLLLWICLRRVRSGQLPAPRAVLIVLAVTPFLLTLLVMPPYPASVTVATITLPLFPRIWLAFILLAALIAGLVVYRLLRHPYALTRGDALGMPRAGLNLVPSSLWITLYLVIYFSSGD
jgi:hypothetical protein